MNTDKVLYAMQLVVKWTEMKDLCEGRSQCTADESKGVESCPFRTGKSCDMVSTEKVMRSASDVFQEYLAEIEEI